MRIRYHGCNHIVSDLTKVRLTHVRIHHLQASRMRIQHGKYYFLPPQRWVRAPATLSFAHRQIDVGNKSRVVPYLTPHLKLGERNHQYASQIWTPLSNLADHIHPPSNCAHWCVVVSHHPFWSDVVGHAIMYELPFPWKHWMIQAVNTT